MGLILLEKKIFLIFYHYKSMGANDPRGVASLDPRGPIQIATYEIYKLWASWFQRRRFFKFFPLKVYGT